MTTILIRVRQRRACKRIARQLQSYIDGELPATDTKGIAAHLAACRRCGIDEQAYTDLIVSLAGLSIPIDPPVLERLRTFVDHIDQQTG